MPRTLKCIYTEAQFLFQWKGAMEWLIRKTVESQTLRREAVSRQEDACVSVEGP